MPAWIKQYWVEVLFGFVVTGLTFYVRHLSKRLKRELDEQKALRDGMRSLLRRQIQEDCEKAIMQRYCEAPKKSTIEDMYESYHALGGNGVITNLVESMMQLPTFL